MSKSVIVTGASGGIGTEIVRQIAEQNYRIWALIHHMTDEVMENFNKISSEYGTQIEVIEAEFLDQNAVGNAVKSILKKDKEIGVLINNAGMSYNKTLAMTPIKEMEDVFHVNFVIPSLIAQLVSRSMIRSKEGCIVNIISRSAMEVRKGTYAYGASKAALAWGTRAMAAELAAYGIRVNGIAPGLTETKMGSLGRSDEETQNYILANNIKRPAHPEEIANVVMFLISEKASYISGQIVSVDGGRQ